MTCGRFEAVFVHPGNFYTFGNKGDTQLRTMARAVLAPGSSGRLHAMVNINRAE